MKAKAYPGFWLFHGYRRSQSAATSVFIRAGDGLAQDAPATIWSNRATFRHLTNPIFPTVGGAAVALDAMIGGNGEFPGLRVAGDRLDRAFPLAQAALDATGLLHPAVLECHGREPS